MTLLANESTADARKILKKYGKNDPKNYDELEVKLAELYFETPDKLELEKELAEIHPHKKWLTRVLPPQVEVKEEIKTVEVKSLEDKSSFNDCQSSSCPCNKFSNCCGAMSSFNGNEDTKQRQTPDYLGLIGVISIVGLTFYFLSKNTK